MFVETLEGQYKKINANKKIAKTTTPQKQNTTQKNSEKLKNQLFQEASKTKIPEELAEDTNQIHQMTNSKKKQASMEKI